MFFSKKKATLDVDVLFHSDANMYGSHGEIIVNHTDNKYNHKVIRFVFKGMVNPPALTPQVLEYLFQQAQDNGYIPFEVIRYGTVIDLNKVAAAQLQNDSKKEDVMIASMYRRQYLEALQSGYPHTYERWKKEVIAANMFTGTQQSSLEEALEVPAEWNMNLNDDRSDSSQALTGSATKDRATNTPATDILSTMKTSASDLNTAR